jgi:exopolysaccharide production protein ExoQ
MTLSSTAGPPIGPEAAIAAPLAPPHRTPFNLGVPLNTLADMGFAVFWSMISVFPVPGATPLRYLCAAYVVAGLFLYPRQMLPTLARGALIFGIPLLCIISATWAPSSGDAIKKGVMLSLTGLFAIYFASRLTTRQLLFTYLVFEFGAGILSLGNLGAATGPAGGIFGQKNYLATHMFILYMAGLTLLLDRGAHRYLRTMGALALPIGGLLIVLSMSTTTIGLTAAGTFALMVHAFVWGPAKKVPHLRSIMTLLGILVGLILAILLFGIMQFDVGSKLLEVAGKDSTLTGRTYLWDIAKRIMAEHPLTGLGANGFWRPEIGDANSIANYFFYDSFTQFSFHNSYYEVGVQLGYPGMYLAIILASWALGMAAWNWLQNQTVLNFFFFLMSAMAVIRTNTEADLVTDFNSMLILLCIGAVRSGASPEASAQMHASLTTPAGDPPTRGLR